MGAFEATILGISGVLLVLLIAAEQLMFKRRFKDSNVWVARW